jgi:hypothetical protein
MTKTIRKIDAPVKAKIALEALREQATATRFGAAVILGACFCMAALAASVSRCSDAHDVAPIANWGRRLAIMVRVGLFTATDLAYRVVPCAASDRAETSGRGPPLEP